MNGISTYTPDYEAATGLLSHLNSEELRELLNDDDKLNNVIKDLQQVKNIEAEKEMILASNKSIAEFNLSMKPTLEESRIAVTSLYSRASDLKVNVTDKKEKLEKGKKSTQSLSSVLAVLQARTAEVEEETETYIEKLLAGEANVDEFLNLFLTTRTKVHVLHTKVDKMTALLQNPNEHSLQPIKPVRNKKAPPPPRPLPPTQMPVNPFITANPFPQPLMPLIPRMHSIPTLHDQRAIVPTRIAPQPPPIPNFMPPNPQQMPGAYGSMRMYPSPSVPFMPQPYLQVNMPKKY